MRAAALIALLIAILGAAGCSKAARPHAAALPGAANRAFKVALLLPRSINSDAWTRSGYKGLQLIQRELGASVAYKENVSDADFERAYQDFAAEGYDFVIGHGAQFVSAAEKAAAAFPRTSFAVVGPYAGNNVNLGGISMREGEMGYLFGAIAAIKTRTKRIAYLGGAENPSGREITAAFARGARSIDPAVRVLIDWVGDFSDAAKARGIARDQIEGGVDVILVLAGAAGEGVHAQAQAAGIFTLAWIEDQSRLAPRAVLTSNVQDVPALLLRGAALASQGRWEGKQYRFGLAEGVQGLAPFHGLLSREEERRVLAIERDLLAGKIDAAG